MDQFVKLRHGNVTYTGKSKLVQFYVLNVTAGINNQSQLQFNILLQRMYFYHLAATYLPTICLLIIAELTLYIDESHFDTTIMVSLTSMLVMYTLYQSIAASLPQTAYLKMIDIWLLFGLMTPFVVFLFEVFFQLLKQRLESGSTENSVKVLNSRFLPPSARFVRSEGPRISAFKTGCKFCVPVVSLAFVVIYWMIAAVHYYLRLL